MHRSELTIDLGAVRRNAQRLLAALAGSALWAVVKADGYGHGAVDVAGAALGAGATVVCTATVSSPCTGAPGVSTASRMAAEASSTATTM